MARHFYCHHLPSERAGINSKCSNGDSIPHFRHSFPVDPLLPKDIHCYVWWKVPQSIILFHKGVGNYCEDHVFLNMHEIVCRLFHRDNHCNY